MSNGYIQSKADAANIPTIRNLSDVAQSKSSMASPNEVADELNRAANLRARAQQNLRAQISGDAKEAAFRIALRGVPQTPEQISDLVPRLLALLAKERPAEENEAATEATTASPTEENDPAIPLP
jgi:hypothetical protein